MKELLFTLIARILPVKTVEGALSALNRAITLLEAARQAEEKKAQKYIDSACAYTDLATQSTDKAGAAQAKADHAAKVAARLQALVS